MDVQRGPDGSVRWTWSLIRRLDLQAEPARPSYAAWEDAAAPLLASLEHAGFPFDDLDALQHARPASDEEVARLMPILVHWLGRIEHPGVRAAIVHALNDPRGRLDRGARTAQPVPRSARPARGAGARRRPGGGADGPARPRALRRPRRAPARTAPAAACRGPSWRCCRRWATRRRPRSSPWRRSTRTRTRPSPSGSSVSSARRRHGRRSLTSQLARRLRAAATPGRPERARIRAARHALARIDDG